MSEVQPIDETLDRLEHAVAGLTTSTNIDALRYIHQLGQNPGCSRHAAESARHIADLCTQAQSSLIDSIDHMEAERDDTANSYLGHALVHLDKIAETVASVMRHSRRKPEAEAPRSEAK
jgi:hypothetical protein